MATTSGSGIRRASLHDELHLLVQAGLFPTTALAAATSAPAAAFGLTGRGGIAPGMRADLVVVQGDPEHDITRTRTIERVWRAGHRHRAPRSRSDRGLQPRHGRGMNNCRRLTNAATSLR
jgi:imidazolonepropionase-like amidohydrolase